ncbi:MAG: hypothetical protein LBT21_04790 [Oscillospiraceae bacterium]|nr:hypothetical protein [Oscillospiraceae bacterium]
MFCPNCGVQAEAGSTCPNCGIYIPAQADAPQAAAPPPYPPQQPYQQPYGQPAYGAPPVEDTPNGGLNFLGCCIPMAGLIMYLVMKDQTPNKAKAIGKWTLIGLGINVLLGILYSILIAAGAFAGFMGGAFDNDISDILNACVTSLFLS